MTVESKVCRKCSQLLPRASFYACKGNKDGIGAYCRECAKRTRREYRSTHLAQEAEYQKVYYAENAAKLREEARKNYQANRDRRLSLHREWRSRNVERERVYCREYHKKHRHKWAKRISDWCKAHPEFKAFHAQKRRAKLRNAMPSWLTDDQIAQIASFYEDCAKVSRETGVPHHVDHIIPLQGENVSGLHVPWNLQVIPAAENIRKSNKLVAA